MELRNWNALRHFLYSGVVEGELCEVICQSQGVEARFHDDRVIDIHSLNLKSPENRLLHIPLLRTTLFYNSFTCLAPKLWNALPQTVRASGSLLVFKKNL